ncbi:hypothetical protein ACYJW8_08860 [Frateuria aurantia]
MSFIAHNIEYSSRSDVASEIDEMQAFISELEGHGLTALVTRIFYDSKANICSIECDGPANNALWEIAEKHITQFELDGIIGHRHPLFDSKSEMEEIDGDERAPTDVTPEDAKRRRAELGREGEQALANWFSRNGLSYLSICQSPETFAHLFAGTVKRPDFFLLFDSLGLVAVDAKNISLYKEQYFALPLEDEVRRAVAFERIFRMPLWYALYTQECWYWISALKAIEVGKHLKNSATGQVFLSISKDDFVPISAGCDLGNLYGQRMPEYGNTAGI